MAIVLSASLVILACGCQSTQVGEGNQLEASPKAELSVDPSALKR